MPTDDAPGFNALNEFEQQPAAARELSLAQRIELDCRGFNKPG